MPLSNAGMSLFVSLFDYANHRLRTGGSGQARRGGRDIRHTDTRSQGGHQMRRLRAARATTTTEISKSDEQWRQELTPQQYDVLRRGRTEPAFTGQNVHAKQNGSYCCAGCGSELFRSDSKFDSRTGWPSFTEPAVAEAVELRADYSFLMRRTEVICRRCGGHLGHVFRDGPARPASATALTPAHWPSSPRPGPRIRVMASLLADAPSCLHPSQPR